MKTADDSFKFERVLLIDDNDIDNFINERMITTNQFSKAVIVKNSAEAALQFLKDNDGNDAVMPQLIFLDLNLSLIHI